LLEIFGFFLLILIGIELLESIKAYDGLTIIGIAALIITIAVAYFFLKRTTLRRKTQSNSEGDGSESALP